MVKLDESSPGDIDQWCVSMVNKPPREAARMAGSIAKLDYDRLPPETVSHVEDALYYAMTGQRRSSPTTRPTPGFSARRTSPNRRSSANLSSGFRRPPMAE